MHKKAFTLIELLVVIAVLGLLASIILVSLSDARKTARDAERMSETRQVVPALEQYFLDNGNYPIYNSNNPVQNWADTIYALEFNGYLAKKERPLSKFKEFILGKIIVFANSLPPTSTYPVDPSAIKFQDPIYPDQAYEYMVSSDAQDYRIRIKLEKTNNPVLSSSEDGSFLDTSTSGHNACDSSLGYYCRGMKPNFSP